MEVRVLTPPNCKENERIQHCEGVIPSEKKIVTETGRMERDRRDSWNTDAQWAKGRWSKIFFHEFWALMDTFICGYMDSMH